MNEISLGNVLVAAELGRAPVVAESAGYLALAVADQLLRAPVSVDAGCVGLSVDGLVVIEGARASSPKEAEASVRALLASLLGVSKGTTPALGAAARRSSGSGVAALVAELEGALIPVNRGAAKRAIARLARETSRARDQGALRRAPKRKTAEPALLQKPAARPTAEAPIKALVPTQEHAPTPPPAPFASPPPLFVEDAEQSVESVLPTPVLAVHDAPVEPSIEIAFVAEEELSGEEDVHPLSLEISRPIFFDGDELTPVEEADGMTHRLPKTTFEHTLPLRFGEPPSELAALSAQPVVVVALPKSEPPASLEAAVQEALEAPVPDEEPAVHRPSGIPPEHLQATAAPQTVDELLSSFAVSNGIEEHEVRNLLKQAAGLEPTALPPSVESALEMSDHSPANLVAEHEQRPLDDKKDSPAILPDLHLVPPRNPRAGTAVMFVLLLLALAAAVFTWVRFPGLFTGR